MVHLAWVVVDILNSVHLLNQHRQNDQEEEIPTKKRTRDNVFYHRTNRFGYTQMSDTDIRVAIMKSIAKHDKALLTI